MSQETLVTSLGHTGKLLNEIQDELASTNKEKKRKLFARLARSRAYRALFVDKEISVGIPFQIRGMREREGWTQQELADRTGKRQSVISQLESPGYGRLTLSTLKKLAAAFDVALMVRFVPFSELVGRSSDISETDLKVPSFENDDGRFDASDGATSSLLVEDTGSTPAPLRIVGDRRDPLQATLTITRSSSEEYEYGRSQQQTGTT